MIDCFQQFNDMFFSFSLVQIDLLKILVYCYYFRLVMVIYGCYILQIFIFEFENMFMYDLDDGNLLWIVMYFSKY